MASPFDLYQQRQFDGLDPNKFNKDYYAELQKSLFANSLKDQLLGFKSNYEKELELQAANKQQIEASSKKLEDLNSKTDSYVNNLKKAERAVNSTQNMINSYARERDSAAAAQNRAQANLRNSQAAYNNARAQQAKYQEIYVEIANAIRINEQRMASSRPGKSVYETAKRYIQNLKNNSDYKNWNAYQAQMNTYANRNTQYSREANQLQAQVNSWNSKIEDQRKNVLAPRQQALQQANNVLNSHKNEVAQTGQQIQNLTQATGASSQAAQKAITDAQALQDKITNYQARSEPLKDLETKIEGDYATATKASNEELKRIAANSLDPISQKNAQNLLNQRAEQLAKTFGKNVEDVKKELGVDVTIAPEQFASQEAFNQFMGIEAAKQAELQDPGALNNLQEQIMPKPAPAQQLPAAGSPQQATIQPFGDPQPIAQPALTATPPQPVTPPQQAPQTQQMQNQAQVQTSGMPANPAPPPQPQQPNTPQQQPAARQASGMPKPPAPQPRAAFGAINPYVRQGMASQIRQGFQNAMRIKATPQPRQPKTAADPMEERRKAVAAQASGTPVSSQQQLVKQKQDDSKAFGMNQNQQVKTQQSTVTGGAGRRQPR